MEGSTWQNTCLRRQVLDLLPVTTDVSLDLSWSSAKETALFEITRRQSLIKNLETQRISHYLRLFLVG